jgi:hypothetical protein
LPTSPSRWARWSGSKSPSGVSATRDNGGLRASVALRPFFCRSRAIRNQFDAMIWSGPDGNQMLAVRSEAGGISGDQAITFQRLRQAKKTPR